MWSLNFICHLNCNTVLHQYLQTNQNSQFNFNSQICINIIHLMHTWFITTIPVDKLYIRFIFENCAVILLIYIIHILYDDKFYHRVSRSPNNNSNQIASSKIDIPYCTVKVREHVFQFLVATVLSRWNWGSDGNKILKHVTNCVSNGECNHKYIEYKQ